MFNLANTLRQLKKERKERDQVRKSRAQMDVALKALNSLDLPRPWTRPARSIDRPTRQKSRSTCRFH